VEPPTLLPQYFLTQQITITGSFSAMVRSSVALDTQNVAVGIPGVSNCEIDSIGTRPDLLIDIEAPFAKGLGDRIFEVICFTARWSGDRGWKFPAALAVRNEIPEGDGTAIVWIYTGQIVAAHARYEDRVPFRSRD